jgi:thioredoxin reductase
MGMNALPRRLDARSQKKEDSSIVRYIVIGGGIAGVCCAQEIARLKKHDSIEVVIITATELLKESAGVMKITNHLEEVSVFERTADRFSLDNPGIRVIQGSVLSIDTSNKIVRLKDDNIFIYEKLCICTGAQPKMIASHPNIIGIRDLQSVTEMTTRLSSARKVLIVGNGGIALELVHSLSFCDVDWVVRDRFLGSSFFDASASAFIMPGLLERISAPSSAVNTKVEIDTTGIKKTVVTVPTDTLKHIIVENAAVATVDSTDDGTETDLPVDITLQEYQRDLRHQGAALGPEWLIKSKLLDNLPSKLKQSPGSLNIHYQQDIVAFREGLNGSWKVIDKHHNDSSDLDKHIISDIEATKKINLLEEDIQDPSHPYPLYVLTSNNDVVGCDFLVSATGVIPCVDFVSSEFLRSDESSNDQSNSSSSSIDLNSVKDTRSKKRKVENTGQRKDGALAVNELMETSVKDVYAAGDCCSYQSAHRYHTNEINSIADETSNNIMAGKHWFQMRLWTQARSMGLYAAQVL